MLKPRFACFLPRGDRVQRHADRARQPRHRSRPDVRPGRPDVADIVTAGVCLVADCSISDPSPIGLFSGRLGPVYSSAGLDTAIGTAIGGVAGPLVASRVAAGFVPVPLTSPPHASIPPLTAGALDFGVPAV